MIGLTQTQFPFGKPFTQKTSKGLSRLTIILTLSAILIGGTLFYLQNSNQQNEN